MKNLCQYIILESKRLKKYVVVAINEWPVSGQSKKSVKLKYADFG